MKTYTIKQKMSGTGSIYDIASDQYDRDIVFPEGCQYAVVIASYYGGKGYTTHKTAEATLKAIGKVKGYSYEIIDTDGNTYVYYDGKLVRE